MQEFLILTTLILGFFFLALSFTTKNWGIGVFAAIFFLALFVGITNTGWERFEPGNVIIDNFSAGDSHCDTNASNCTQITPQTTTYSTDISENLPLWAFSMLILALMFLTGIYSVRTYNESNEENEEE